MTVFFKSTRPDGTDFYSGSVDYAAALTSGEPLPELSGDAMEFPGPGWYHLATVPTECVGMSWPCRLFEVEPVGEVFMDNAHPNKIGCRSVRVLREIEAHRVFGPQGEQVAALIERCRTLSAAEVDRLAAARYADRDRDVTWGAAWDAVSVWGARDVATWGAALTAAWDAAWYAVSVWGGARGAAWGAVWGAWDAARDAAWGAAWDAAAALLCRDLIGQAPGWDQDMYDLLTGPWRDVIGPIHPDDGDIPDDLTDGAA